MSSPSCIHCGATGAPETDALTRYIEALARDGHYVVAEQRGGLVRVQGVPPHAREDQTWWICSDCIAADAAEERRR